MQSKQKCCTQDKAKELSTVKPLFGRFITCHNVAITYSHLSLLALTNSDENGESLHRELLTALLLNYLHIGNREGSWDGIFPSFIT